MPVGLDHSDVAHLCKACFSVCLCRGCVRNYSLQHLVGNSEAEEMPVLSDMSYSVFVEKSLYFFSRSSASVTLLASVDTRACL